MRQSQTRRPRVPVAPTQRAYLSRARALGIALAFVVGSFALGRHLTHAQELERPAKIRGWPLYYSESYSDGRFERHAFFSMYYRSQRLQGESLFLTPFYWSNEEYDTERDWSLLLPVYFRKQDRARWSFWSLPFSRGGRHDESQSWFWAPGFAPFFSQGKLPQGHSVRAGVPLALDLFGSTRDQEGTATEVLGLLPWRTPGRSLLPLFQTRRNLDGSLDHTHLFPIYSYSPGRHISILPLLWWRNYTGEERTQDLVLPMLGAIERSEDGYRWSALLGLWNGGKRDERSWLRLEPFFTRSRSPQAGSFDIARLYGRSWNEEANTETHRVLPPLGSFQWNSEGHQHRFLPFYFSYRAGDSSAFALAPFYFRQDSPGTRHRLLFPLYFSRHSEADRARIGFPLYWHFQGAEYDDLHVLPLYSRIKRKNWRLDLALGPIYMRYERPSRELVRHSFLWPLFQSETFRDGWHRHALPFYWGTRRGPARFDLLAPLYLYAANQEGSHHWLLPFWGKYRSRQSELDETLERTFYGSGLVTHTAVRGSNNELKRDSVSVLGPLAGYSRDLEKQRRSSRLLPLWWRQSSPKRSRSLLFPFYYSSHQRAEEERDATHLRLVAGNLWLDWKTEKARHRGVLWPLTSHYSSAEGSFFQALGLYSQRSAHPLGSRASMPGEFESSRLTPFWYYTRNAEPNPWLSGRWLHLFSRESADWGHRTWLFPGLFYREVREEDVRWATLMGLVGASQAGEEHHFRALPFYYSQRTGDAENPQHRLQIAFPWFHQSLRNHGEKSSLSLLFPLYYQEQNRQGLSHRSVLWPLFSWDKGPGFRRGRFLMLAGYDFDSHTDRSWHVFPVVRSLRSSTEVEGLWSADGYLMPTLFHRTRGPSTRTSVLHPFLWGYHRDDERDETQWDALGFLASHRRGPDFRRTHALGLFHAARGKSSSWWSVFPLAYSHELHQDPLPTFLLPQALHVYSHVADADRSRWSVLGLLADGSHEEATGNGHFRVLYRWAVFRKQGSYSERVFEPFFTWESDAATGYHYHSILKFLYISSRPNENSPTTRRLFGIPM